MWGHVWLVDAALQHNEAARVVAAQIGTGSTIGMYHAFLNQVALLRGTVSPEAGLTALAAMQRAPGIPLVRIYVPLIHALRGDYDLARATFEEFRHMPGLAPWYMADGGGIVFCGGSAQRIAGDLALANRQIAEQLVLSERTVETHVRSILAKLGYSTRTEIATWSLRRATP